MGSPGKKTGVGSHALLQGIFLTRALNPCLLHLLRWQAGSFLPSHQGSPPAIGRGGLAETEGSRRLRRAL